MEGWNSLLLVDRASGERIRRLHDSEVEAAVALTAQEVGPELDHAPLAGTARIEASEYGPPQDWVA